MKKILILSIILFAMLFTGCMSTGNTENEITLLQAVRLGDTAIVKKMIAGGADITIKDEYGLTLLANAATRGYTAIAEALLEAGADVNATDSVRTVLIHAVAGGHTATVEALLVAGADVNATGHGGITALMSVATGNLATVEVLINAGADVNAKDKYGFTALLNSAYHGYLDIAELLIANGAEIEKIDSSNTALMHASAESETRMLLFLEGGAVLEAIGIYSAYDDVQDATLLESMKSLQEAFDDVMSTYSRIWRTGIEMSDDGVLKNSAMPVFLTTEECYVNGANALLDEHLQSISDKVKILDKTADSNTLKCSALLAEYESIIKNIPNSFSHFSASKTRLNSEFQSVMALAMVE